MEWDTNPLLREEIQAVGSVRPMRAERYRWVERDGLSILSWQGHTIGTVQPNGAYSLHWRGREHRGTAGSRAQAIRFMSRWLARRGTSNPIDPADARPSTLVPLGDFLRDYTDMHF